MTLNNRIYGINGPVVTVLTGGAEHERAPLLEMAETVLVGPQKLVGEVISVNDKLTTIQVYEDTGGLRAGDDVISTGMQMSVTLGPGLLGNIYDGVQKPLKDVARTAGVFLPRGADAEPLDTEKRWQTRVLVKAGDELKGGAIFAECRETQAITHRSMLPPGLSGKVVFAAEDGEYTVTDVILKIEDAAGVSHDVRLAQKWSIRKPRPAAKRLSVTKPMLTGQRVIDTMFPVGMGGAAAIPGGFGTGKTVCQHQLAKFADADIIVYVGCGERGNEMTQALNEFSELEDPNTGRPLLERTILIANTSNMPVAAREASIYTGITLAEYYRDMGYNTAIMADSTSRWAEALREISGRLEEMPADEGYPAYLPSRLSKFYERAGYFEPLGGGFGSVTIIGAVSPQGADFSEPVTQNTKRFTRCFWALDKSLAYARHYPAINWNDSYSEYVGQLSAWYEAHVAPDFIDCRNRIAEILAGETALMEIVKLIGSEMLPEDQKLTLETARAVRVGFLQQNAMDPVDTYTPVSKHYRMMKLILRVNELALDAVRHHVPVARIKETGVFELLTGMKINVPNDKPEIFDSYTAQVDEIFARLAEN